MTTKEFIATADNLWRDFIKVFKEKNGTEKDARTVYMHLIRKINEKEGDRKWMEKIEEAGATITSQALVGQAIVWSQDDLNLHPFESWAQLYYALENLNENKKLTVDDILKSNPSDLYERFK